MESRHFSVLFKIYIFLFYRGAIKGSYIVPVPGTHVLTVEDTCHAKHKADFQKGNRKRRRQPT